MDALVSLQVVITVETLQALIALERSVIRRLCLLCVMLRAIHVQHAVCVSVVLVEVLAHHAIVHLADHHWILLLAVHA